MDYAQEIRSLLDLFNLKEVSERTEVPYATLYKWKSGSVPKINDGMKVLSELREMKRELAERLKTVDSPTTYQQESKHV